MNDGSQDTLATAIMADLYQQNEVVLESTETRDEILQFLKNGSRIVLNDLHNIFLKENEGGLKKGSKDYLLTLENILGGVTQHTLLQDRALIDYADVLQRCVDRVKVLERQVRRADLDRNADAQEPYSILKHGNDIDLLATDIAEINRKLLAALSDVTPADLMETVQELRDNVNDLKGENVDDFKEVRAEILIVRGLIDFVRRKIEGPQGAGNNPRPDTPFPHPPSAAGRNQVPTNPPPQPPGRDTQGVGNPPPAYTAGGVGGGPNPNQGSNPPPGAAPAHAPEPSQRGAKCPKLNSIEHAEFEEFLFNFEMYAEDQTWTEHQKKVNAFLSLTGKASQHLRNLLPGWREPTVTLKDLFAAWTKRVLPQAQVTIAIKHVSTIQQQLDETFDDYLLRGQNMHHYAYGRDPNHANAEVDQDFIVRLIAGLRDRSIKAHVERSDPKTITALREIVHREAAIALDPLNPSGSVSINALSPDQTEDLMLGINAIDPARSNRKPLPPCEICRDSMHATSQCALLEKFRGIHKRQQDEKRKNRKPKLTRGSRARGRRGGRGAARRNDFSSTTTSPDSKN